MKERLRGKMTLMNRIVLFLTAFSLLLLVQTAAGVFQYFSVLRPMGERMESILQISSFLSEVDRCMGALADYRWDYGDQEALAGQLRSFLDFSAGQKGKLAGKLGEVSEEYYLLSNAAQTTCDTLDGKLEGMVAALDRGDTQEAARLYYGSVVSCGAYLLQYTRQLLERGILDTHDQFAAIRALELRLDVLRAAALAAAALLGCALFASLLSLLRSVAQIARASRHISRGEFDTPDVDQSRRDEIGEMASAFNEMKRSTKRYVDTLREKQEIQRELHAKETEALALQGLMEREKLQQLRSQINPHFLFNTLNMIMHTARQEGAQETEALVGSLSQVFRYALGSNEELEPLSREMYIIQQLYTINKARFGERIGLVWHIDPELDTAETLVPPFLLQPLAENAFHHGLQPKAEGGRVDIFIRRQGEMLDLRVEDNGVGMTQEELEALKTALAGKEIPSEHIGLYNVAHRLRLMEGASGLTIWSQAGEGSSFSLRLPLRVVRGEEDEEDYEDTDCG